MRRIRAACTMILAVLLIFQMTPIALGQVHASTVWLEDDFESYIDSPVGDTWINSTNNGEWVVDTADDSQVLKLNSAGTTYVVARGDEDWENYTYSARIKITSMPTEGTVRAGIVARHTDKKNYYTLMIRRSLKKDYLLLTKRVNNSEITLVEETLTNTIDTNKVYHLKLELSGISLKGYVDDVLFADISDDSLSHGSIGLYSNSKDSYEGTVWFDDVLVQGGEIPGEGGETPDEDGETPDDGENVVTIQVSNSDQLNDALEEAGPGTTIELADGTYDDMDNISSKYGTEEHPIVIKAMNPGGAVITGNTLYIKNSAYIVLEGLKFQNSGYYGVRLTDNHHIRLTNNHFELPPRPSGSSSTWIQIDGALSHHNRIDHNVFENKQDPGKFIVIGGDNPGFTNISQYDRIDHNVFRNTVERQTNESEPIRIGESKLSLYDSYTTIEHNWFEHTDSDPEIISIKSGKNTIRYNTFYESLGTVTLRHGDGSSVYGNRFIGNGRVGTDQDGNPIGTGGIRVYGDDHLIFNNYFSGLTGSKWDAPITITNGDADYESSSDLSKHFRPRNIQIVHNTFVDNVQTIELGYTNNGKYNKPPQDITIANNIAVTSEEPIVVIHSNESEIMSEVTWEGNIMYPKDGAELGVEVTSDQIQVTDPKLVDNGEGIMIPSSDSPALDAAVGDYSFVYDMDETRASANDVGAYEGDGRDSNDGEEPDGGDDAVPNRLEVIGVTASSHDGNFPENVLDGDLTTRWSAESAEVDGELQGEWLLLDLGAVETVSYVGLAFHNGHLRTSRFVLEVSSDGDNWIEVFDGQSSGTTLDMEAYDFEDVEARFVKFIGYGNSSNNWNSLLEVHVYGPSSDGTPVLEDIVPPPEEPPGDTTPYTVPGLYEQDGTPHAIHIPNPVTGETLNVINFGAVPNDGQDDMAAIEAALSEAEEGDEIYFPHGVYDLIGTWSNDGTSQVVLKSGVNIRGESESGTILLSHFDNNTPNGKVMRAYAEHDVVISDLTISSTFSGQYSSDHKVNNPEANGPEYGIYIEEGGGQPSYNITIEHVTVEKFQKMGIRISRSHDVVVRNVTFQNATDVGGGGAGYGISIQGVVKEDRIGYANDTLHNLVENSTFKGPYLRHGVILQYYAHNNEIRNNVFESTVLDAIDLHGELEYMNKIDSNTINGVLTGAGIALGNTGGTAPSNHSASGPDNYIVNNTITNSREGIKVHMGTPDTLIEGNTIENTTEPASSRGILIQNAPRTIIQNNVITNNTADDFWGIVLEYDPGDTNAGNVGSGNPQDVQIIGNTVTGNSNGIRIAAGTGTVLMDNEVYGNLGIDFEDLTSEAPEEVVMIHPVDDAKIDIDRPDENYGLEDPEKTESGASDRNWYRLFNVKANDDFTFGRIAYMKFDLSAVEDVENALLELHGRTGSNTTSVKLDVYGLTNDDWEEETLTWNNSFNHEPDLVKVTGEGTTAFYVGSITINSPDITKYTVDVSDFVKEHTDENVTFMIVDTIGQNGNVNIMSKEDSNPDNRPLLRIGLSSDGGTEPDPAPGYPLQIGEIQIVDLDGNLVDDLEGVSFVRVSTLVTNVSDSVTDGTLIIALYGPDHAITRIAFVEHSIEAGETVDLGGGFDLPDDAGTYILKVFAWSNLDSMKPLSEDEVVFRQ